MAVGQGGHDDFHVRWQVHRKPLHQVSVVVGQNLWCQIGKLTNEKQNTDPLTLRREALINVLLRQSEELESFEQLFILLAEKSLICLRYFLDIIINVQHKIS